MGLSRNKVAVSEGAAGSPPFYGDTDTFSRMCRIANRSNDDEILVVLAEYELIVVQFSVTGKQPHKYGGVAQLGEHLPCKQGVMGSNPIISTSKH